MGKLKKYDGKGRAGNLICGDVMELYIKVKNDRIEKISFLTMGCAAAIATSSIVTELAKGKTIQEAMKIEKEDITNSLGELPQAKIHCSFLAVDALREAIYDYLIKNKLPIPEELEKTHKRVQKGLEVISERGEVEKLV